MATDAEILEEIDSAFGAVARPDHFTNFTHCSECADHDALLRARDRETLSIADVGNPGWDPLCFASAEGIGYYFPTLARLALHPPADSFDWYADQLLFHLGYGSRDNRFFKWCRPPQRAAVAHFLAHLIESRAALLEENFASDECTRCHGMWNSWSSGG